MTHVVIVGAGMAGLIAGYSAIKAGHTVTVLEASGRPGGAVQAEHLELPEGVLAVDAGAEAYAARSTVLDELLKDLGLADDIVTPNPAGSWMYLPDVGAVPAPRVGMWGIPGDPTAQEVVAALGVDGAARAAQDLHTPMDLWAKRRAAGAAITVGELVADRFGPVVVERLVAPVVAGVHSADPYDVDIDKIAPGLVDKAIEQGSVAKAIADLRAAAPPGAAVKSVRGGMQQLVNALVTFVQARGQLEYGAKAIALDMETRTVVTETRQRVQGDHIVLAVDAPTVHDLLATSTALPQRAELPAQPALGAGVALVIMAVDCNALDAQPRGTGILVSPNVTDVAAKAATHVTAKWQWARDDAQELKKHRHIVRLSYGRVTDSADGSAPGHDTAEQELLRLARKDLSRMFDVAEEDIGDNLAQVAIIRWRTSMPLTTPENSRRIAGLQEAVQDIDGLHLTGAWFAGTGLAAIAHHSLALSFNPLQ
ncbi:protoporphyrinogen/coproporphyrinogen oxidase [Yaniella halotolerans]|uniref:protoporphyrinogen/coproporphyrinogen oxidase n=1 Tax=Yaniella halotolerans TaxID=225453 RepID=UPI0003B55668|nr:FAD-dependent oxidoreductase [Yaniella halotolerans]